MGIDLGLRRVTALLGLLGNPHKTWYSIHVAGTNGKGSVCAYLTSVLKSANIRSGRFTSPHLVNRWDSITIDGVSISEAEFNKAESKVRAADTEHGIQATEFELLTAVAFEIFAKQKVTIAVVEVGLGGRLDSTNVLEPPQVHLSHSVSEEFESDSKSQKCGVLATIITKIGLDHQSFLGDTLEKIAYQKAGIIKPGVPCVVDASNEPETLSAVEKIANEVGAPLTKAAPILDSLSNTHIIETSSWGPINTNLTPLLGNYQKANLSCSLNALEILRQWFPNQLKDKSVIENGIRETEWSGRLQWLNIPSVGAAPPVKILLDGAHNPQAAEELAQFLDENVRTSAQSGQVNFVIAFTKGKDYGEIINRVIRPGDNVVTTQFGDVDGMPWIRSFSAEDTSNMVKNTIENVNVKAVSSADLDNSQLEAINQCRATSDSPIVVFGSLYLAGKIIEKVNYLK